MAGKLTERAMLAGLHIGAWAGKLLDPDVTDEVSENHKAEKNAGRYTKQIVATRFLSQVGSKINVARQSHRLLTLPWDDDGTRILSTRGYLHYTEIMRTNRLAVESAAKEFVKGMPDYIQEARVRLGTMFNKDDYPEPAAVRKKFYIDVEIKPLPEAADFRAKLSDDSTKAIMKDIERRGEERIKAAMQDVFERIADVTRKMKDRLKAYEQPNDGDGTKNVFRDSLVMNVKTLADLLPSLNITGDPRLDQLQKDLLEDLVDNSPEILRTDAKVRKLTASKADQILKKVESYLA